MAVFSLSVASVYVLNQMADVNVDKFNKGLPLLAKGKISMAGARTCAVVCAAVSILLPLLRHPPVSVFSAGAVALGIIYSFRPFRLSGRCYFDFLANAAGYGIVAFGVGWYFSGASFALNGFAASALPYFLLMCAGSISSTLPDYEGDRKCGKATTAVALGIRPAHIIATILLTAGLFVSLLFHDVIALACAAGALPLYVFYFIRPSVKSMEATYKAGGLISMLVAMLLMPIMGLAAGCMVILTWLYYKLRHHIAYPTLVPLFHEE
jgi:4-hydroxybenzoate polyprenyltransferase